MKRFSSNPVNLARWVPILMAVLLTAQIAGAQSAARSDAAASDVREIDVVRDASDLPRDIRPRPIDDNTADTLLLFTNNDPDPVRVKCLARNTYGEVIGRARTGIAGNGLSYLRASDLSYGRDFVGHAECKTSGHTTATSVFVGPDLTNLDVQSRQSGHVTLHDFPAIATY
ncbi:hypothetical protein MK489_19485 [Myxococcota bacterium]|nr:hypothetical protein [Myxococcota bacterium]